MAVGQAKASLTGAITRGYGSSINNQCNSCIAGGSIPTTPPPPSNPTDPPKTIPAQRKSVVYNKTEKKHIITYVNPIMDSCKSSTAGVCDLYTYGVFTALNNHQCCTNSCLLNDATNMAIEINKACRYYDPISHRYLFDPACEAFLVDLPRTTEQAVKNDPPHWAVYVALDCSEANRRHSPLVDCWCNTVYGSNSLMSGAGFMACLAYVLGYGAGCKLLSPGTKYPGYPEDSHLPPWLKLNKEGCAAACHILAGIREPNSLEDAAECAWECVEMCQTDLQDIPTSTITPWEIWLWMLENCD